MTRGLVAGAAAVAFAAAIVLLLLASDVRRWERALARDDIAFRESPADERLFDVRERVPGVSRTLLAIEDDLAFRRALQLVWRSVPNPEVELRGELEDLRRAAELELAEIGATDPDPARRAQATNILGVLSIAGYANQIGAAPGARIESAIVSFRSAILLDDANEDAKVNLELALRRKDPGDDVNLPRGVAGRGALGRAGSGY